MTCILAPERPCSSLIVWPPVPMTRPTCACATYHAKEEVGQKRMLVDAVRGLDRGLGRGLDIDKAVVQRCTSMIKLVDGWPFMELLWMAVGPCSRMSFTRSLAVCTCRTRTRQRT